MYRRDLYIHSLIIRHSLPQVAQKMILSDEWFSIQTLPLYWIIYAALYFYWQWEQLHIFVYAHLDTLFFVASVTGWTLDRLCKYTYAYYWSYRFQFLLHLICNGIYKWIFMIMSLGHTCISKSNIYKLFRVLSTNSNPVVYRLGTILLVSSIGL